MLLICFTPYIYSQFTRAYSIPRFLPTSHSFFDLALLFDIFKEQSYTVHARNDVHAWNDMLAWNDPQI